MRKKLLLFIGCLLAVHNTAGAVTIKKAAPVAKQEVSAQNVGGNLLPTVVGLVTSVQALNQQQKELTAECIPSSAEINFVNKIIKEWAKTGAANADEVEGRLKMQPCDESSGGYEASVRIAADTNETDMICYDWFGSAADEDTVWYGFPKAVSTYYCSNGTISGCAEKYRKQVSNIYDVFNLVDFTDVDYMPSDEAKLATALMAKIEKCSYAKISARKKALWGDFVTTTIGSLGQKTNSASVIDIVSGMSGSLGSGGMQSLGGLTDIAGKLLAN